jgi:hypothetical protein
MGGKGGAAGGILSVPTMALVGIYLLWTFDKLWVLWVVGGAVVALFVTVLGARMWMRARLYRAEEMALPKLWQLLQETLNGSKVEQKIRRRWEVFCTRQGWMRGKAEKATPLPLVRLKPDLGGDATASINYGSMGLSLDAVMGSAETLATTVECRRVQVVPKNPGWAELAFKYADPLENFLRVRDMPWAQKGRVAYGIREDGSAASLYLGLHALAVGMTRSGKSRWFRALLADLWRQGIPVDFYVGDPSGGAELGLLFEHEGTQQGLFKVRAHAETNAGMYAMFKQAREAMEARMRAMAARHQNPHRPSREEPWVIVIADELLGLDVKKIQEGTDFSMILSRGAKASYWVIGLAQEGHASVLGTMRNLFPQRVVFALPDRFNVDAALGDKAHARGALSHRIDNDNPRNKGLGYSGMEGSAGFDRFRAANVTDDDWARLCRGLGPVGMANVRPSKKQGFNFFCYEVPSFPDENGGREILYVGKTKQTPRARFEQHEQDPNEPWWRPAGSPGNEVDAAAIELHVCKTETEMDRLEMRLIKQKLPKYNTVGNLDNPRRVNRRRPRPAKTAARNRGNVVELPPRETPVDYEGEFSRQAWGE